MLSKTTTCFGQVCAKINQDGKWIDWRESNYSRRGYLPQYWDTAPCWMTIFLPVRTDETATTGQFRVRLTDSGAAQVRNMSMRKLK